MTSAAFETSLPGIGGIAVTICLTFFAFTTALGWCVYGERCATYFFGDKAQIPFRIVYCIAIPVGVLTQLDVVWLLADTCNALMAIPNLICHPAAQPGAVQAGEGRRIQGFHLQALVCRFRYKRGGPKGLSFFLCGDRDAAYY